MKVLYIASLILISNLVSAEDLDDLKRQLSKSNYNQCIDWCKFDYNQAENNFCKSLDHPYDRDRDCMERAARDWSMCVDICERKRD